MKIAIMQPYLFPYLGYFKLINAVDKFVVYDDVNFIKQGWINRNNILVHNRPYLFTVPLVKPSSFAKINDVKINNKLFLNWKKKFYRTLEQSYKSAPNFDSCYELVREVFEGDYDTISSLAAESFVIVCKYLGITTEIIPSSTSYQNNILTGPDRVIDICIREKAQHYINPEGGLKLYDKGRFLEKGLELSFLHSSIDQYAQFKKDFIPELSIIDVIMFNKPEQVREYLHNYSLL